MTPQNLIDNAKNVYKFQKILNSANNLTIQNASFISTPII